MLYINGQLVDLKNEQKDYKFAYVVKDFNSTIKELKEKFGDWVLFKSIYQPKLDSVSKMRKPHKPLTISYKSNVVGDAGKERWVYSSEGATIKDGVAETNEPFYVMQFGSLSLNINDDADLIYYITKTSKVKKGTIYIYDENSKHEKIAEERAREAALNEAIYGVRSPLNDEELLMSVARKWGIAKLDKLKTYTIKNLLYDKVKQAESDKRRNMTSYGVDEFLSEIGDGDAVLVGENIQLAIEKGILSFNKVTGEWVVNVDDTNQWSVLRVDNSQLNRSRDVLIEWLLRNPKDADRLELLLTGNVYVEKGQLVKGVKKEEVDADERVAALNADNIMGEEDYPLLQKAYSHYGLGKSLGVKKVQLKEELKQYFETALAEG